MELIRSRNTVSKKIKDIFDESKSGDSFLFCDGMGCPTYKITIELIEQNEFTDEKGDVWIRKESVKKSE